ncbi:hypothetical protein PybrP1_012547 [[Pythium] brassicae (nom. inval.)]|nr:hypothetical protein PybrP1_012547 [[Pythium] brassicae (nom. inval.)]
MSSSFAQKKQRTLATRKKTRKRRLQAGLAAEDASGRLFQPPSQRDPRWKKPNAQEIVQSLVKRRKTASGHVPLVRTQDDDDDDEVDEDGEDDDGFAVVAAEHSESDGGSSDESSGEDKQEDEASPSSLEEGDAKRHPLRFCTSMDECVAAAAAKLQQIRKTDGRQKAKVLLLVDAPALRKALKAKLNVKQELVKGKSRVGIRSVKANSMAYKNIAILKTPMERFEDANAELLKDFRTGKLPTLIAEDATLYPYVDLRLQHVLLLAKSGATLVHLDRKLLHDTQLHAFVVADSAKAVSEDQRAALMQQYAVATKPKA